MIKPAAQPTKCRTCAALGLALAYLGLGVARMQAEILRVEPTPARKAMDELVDCRAGWAVELDGGADQAAEATLTNVKLGKISDHSFALSAVRSISATPEFAALVGVRFAQTQFEGTSGVALPGKLASAGLPLGLRWRDGAERGIAVDLLPAFTGEPGHLNGRSLNLSGSVLGYWLASERVLLAGGVEFDALGRYPLLPTGGLVFEVSSQWVARILFPQPRLVRQLSKNWSMYLGADFQFDSYRVADDFGTRHQDPALNRAALTFEQILIGPGASWQLGEAAFFEISGGMVTDRRLDYHRAGRDIALRDAPGVRVSAGISF